MSSFTKSPRVGDIACFHSTTKKVEYLRLEDFTSVPAGYTAFGVVYKRLGRKVWIVHITSAYKKWSDFYIWKVSGYTLDNTVHTATLTLAGTVVNFGYRASTAAEVAAAINDALLGRTIDGTTFSSYVNYEGEVILQQDVYTGAPKSASATNLSLTAYVGHELPALSGTTYPLQKNSLAGWGGAVMSQHRALAFLKTTTESSFVMSSPMTTYLSRPSSCLPICYTSWQTENCAVGRAHYGEGLAGWEKMIREHELISPAMKGAASDRYGTGKENTYKLAFQKDGQNRIIYPAFNYCASIGYDGVPGIEVGDWWLPSLNELYDLERNLTYAYKYENGTISTPSRANSDPVNRALSKIGGTEVANNAGAWSSVRYSASYAWFYYGNYGYAGSNYFYSTYRAYPVTLLYIDGDDA